MIKNLVQFKKTPMEYDRGVVGNVALCDLEREIKYIANPDNMLDPQNYRKATINGHVVRDTPEARIETEISFQLQYVYGAAYLKGHTEHHCFQIFYEHSRGFKIDFAKDYKALETDPPVTRYYTALEAKGALETLRDYLAPVDALV